MSCLFRADEMAVEIPKALGNPDCSTFVRGREAEQSLRLTAVSWRTANARSGNKFMSGIDWVNLCVRISTVPPAV